jgi:hypothetical protein
VCPMVVLYEFVGLELYVFYVVSEYGLAVGIGCGCETILVRC